MEVLLVLVGGAIGLVAAIVTASLNNRYERGRLEDMWKREMRERKAHFRRQRLEDKLSLVQRHIHDVVVATDFWQWAKRGVAKREEAVAAKRDMQRAIGVAETTTLTIADKELAQAVDELHRAVRTGELEMDNNDVSGEEREQARGMVLVRASLALKRCDELLDELHDNMIPDD